MLSDLVVRVVVYSVGGLLVYLIGRVYVNLFTWWGAIFIYSQHKGKYTHNHATKYTNEYTHEYTTNISRRLVRVIGVSGHSG